MIHRDSAAEPWRHRRRRFSPAFQPLAAQPPEEPPAHLEVRRDPLRRGLRLRPAIRRLQQHREHHQREGLGPAEREERRDDPLADLGFGRIVVSEIEVSNILANMVYRA